jgi:hypothetical protein
MRTVQSAPGSSIPQDAQIPAPKMHAQNVQSAPSHPLSISIMPPPLSGANGGHQRQNAYSLSNHPQSVPPHQVNFPPNHPYQHGKPPRHDGRSNQTVRSNSIPLGPQLISHPPPKSHPQHYYYNVIHYPNPPGQPSGNHGMQSTATMLTQAELGKHGLMYPAPRQLGPSSVPMATSSDSPMSSSAPAAGNASTPARVTGSLPMPASPSTAVESSTSAQQQQQHQGTLEPMQLDASSSLWLGTVDRISSKQEHDIANKLFPLVYKGDSSGQTECKVCQYVSLPLLLVVHILTEPDSARVSSRDYQVLFYHVLTEHKKAFDLAYAVAFP